MKLTSRLLFAALMLVLSSTVYTMAKTEAPNRPNVLFIAIDDLRTSLGCYGDRLAKTPNLDRLADQGLRFNRAYCQQAVCGPSRVSLLTGLLPDRTRVWHNRNLFRDTLPNAVTLPQLFKNHEYHTQAMGKVFSGRDREVELDPPSWSVPPLLNGKGWRNYVFEANDGGSKKGVAFEAADVDDNGYSDGRLANLAVKTLVQLKEKNQPFFLAVGFFKPHLPFNAPKKYWDLYDPVVLELKDANERVKDAPDIAYHSHRELGGYRDMPPDEALSQEQARTLRHGYYACVSYVDAQVGKVLTGLERLGLEKNTIVVLWGDHGYALGEEARWCKGTNFELDTRVPLIVRAPGITASGNTTDALIEYVDIYPTLAELTSLSVPQDLDGRSLVPILKNPRLPGRDTVLSQFARPFSRSGPEIMGYSLRTNTHRYTRWIQWPGRTLMAEELYDYAHPTSVQRLDAYWVERKNLVADPAYNETRNRLRVRMDRILRERIPVTSSESNSPMKSPEKTILFEEKTNGFVLYRIPGVVVTARGTILAYCEARKYSIADRGEIEIHLRRSMDRGRTWSPPTQIAHLGPRLARNPHMPSDKKKKKMGNPNEQTVNNPVAIADRDGTVHFIYCVEYMRCFYMRSTDDGVTWSKPVEITYAFEPFRSKLDWQVIATGPGHAIQHSSGRLIVPFWMATYEETASLRKASAVIFSDDHGVTWQAGDIAIPAGGECQAAELDDGHVIISSRNTDPLNRRAVAYSSSDGVAGWSETNFVPELLEPGCMASLVSHPGTADVPGPVLLFANPHTTDRPHSKRRNLTVQLSLDHGYTWPVKRLLQPGPSAYSDLAVLPDGTVLCFYESGRPGADRPNRPWQYACLILARFDLAWLVDGQYTENLENVGLRE